jgi:hypothetical protein
MPDTRRPYTPPKLRRLGTIAELTFPCPPPCPPPEPPAPPLPPENDEEPKR